MGGWRFGNTIDGCQAEYVLVPNAMANLGADSRRADRRAGADVPRHHEHRDWAAPRAGIRIGDTVVVFAQGPIGLCATAGARLCGATPDHRGRRRSLRLAMARRLGADETVNFHETDPVEAIRSLTGGRGADVAIEALGTQETFESCLRLLRPGGTLSSLGVYSGKLTLPLDAFAAGLGDHRIITTLCPGGHERMRRLMNVVASGRVDLSGLVTHRFPLDEIVEAYDLFGNQRDGVLKVAIRP